MIKHQYAILIIAIFWFSGLSAQTRNLPNIVFYITDDQSQLDCSVYGNDIIKTPNTAQLAKDGLVFENAFIASPACAPSRAALLTGLMPSRNGAESNHSYPKKGTQILIKNLQESGYDVLSFGKIAHEKMGEYIGFDYYSEDPTNLANHVTEYFQNNTTKKPICLLVGDRRPHVPWTTEKTYNSEALDLPPYFIDTKETRRLWNQYYSDITGADAEMGKIYQLAKEKFGDNFIFIYSADHGGQWPFGKWNLYDAGTKVPMLMVWPKHIKPNTRTDAMVSWIDIFPTLLDIVDAELPVNIDGKSFKKSLQKPNTSHRKYIYTTHSGDKKMNVYPIRSVRNKKYKFILNLYPENYHSNHSDILRKIHAGAYWDSWDETAKTDKRAADIVHKYYVRPAEEFYDIENDPYEQVNLIDSPKGEKALNKMRLLLKDWMIVQNDSKALFEKPYPITGKTPHEIVVKNKNKQTKY
ncbi:sulfatase [uncultured Algibacter sp.]|uniref:sulfatase family protein n=1 Tax=uncultured Algibacter sp. TaxID=298659 RepID=UPI00261091A7|nr:sulfatase [uncultured Algibacter sp.]